MPMKQPKPLQENLIVPELQLSVQYATPVPELSRQQVRAWVVRALNSAYAQDEHEFESAELNLRFVDSDEALALNRSYRDKDYAPNVLSFEYGVAPLGTLRGDIVICWPILQAEAKEQGKSAKDHAAHLVVHGTLHTLGYDHLDDEQAEHMEALEIAILQQMKIANPYI